MDFEVNIEHDNFVAICKHCDNFKKTVGRDFQNKDQIEMKKHWVDAKHVCKDADMTEYYVYVIFNEYRYYCTICNYYHDKHQTSEHFLKLHKKKLDRINVMLNFKELLILNVQQIFLFYFIRRER